MFTSRRSEGSLRFLVADDAAWHINHVLLTKIDICRSPHIRRRMYGRALVLRHLATSKHYGGDSSVAMDVADAYNRHLSACCAQHAAITDTALTPTAAHRLLAVLAATWAADFVMILLHVTTRPHRVPTGPPADAIGASAVLAVHNETLRALAAGARERLSGTFRAAVFGANDGLVSNLALVVGISATGVASPIVLATGMAGLLAGAMSMAAGEYISVRSARELLDASAPPTNQPWHTSAVAAHDLEVIYRARGLDPEQARMRSQDQAAPADVPPTGDTENRHVALGSAWAAARSSFCFFAMGAAVPLVPYLLGVTGMAAALWAVLLVGAALASTGAVVALVSGIPLWMPALRQVTIGGCAAGATHLLGMAFGAAGIG